jgi:DNA/RNA-binding domain of Phe-tRNA-synthetase-like protein
LAQTEEEIKYYFGTEERFDTFLEEIEQTEFVKAYRKAYQDLKIRDLDREFNFQKPS